MSQFDWDATRHGLGIPEMDQTHQEFLALVRALEDCPSGRFAERLEALVQHTEKHFSAEEEAMRRSRCPSLAEHAEEHARLLADLRRFSRSVQKGRPAMARAFLDNGLSDWFANHLATMDAALAAHLHQANRA
ncbi:MAG: hemerythrin family protein [Rhodocyclaceae bacterium]|nr:hemerythrin family protein [Rhodocyclaceae bacterium]